MSVRLPADGPADPARVDPDDGVVAGWAVKVMRVPQGPPVPPDVIVVEMTLDEARTLRGELSVVPSQVEIYKMWKQLSELV